MKREPLTIVNADTGETFDVELPEDVWRDLETFAAVTGMSVEAVIQTAPFSGFAPALNALGILSDVLRPV